MEKISKTARASLRTETRVSRTPVAWIFQHRPGVMQTRPFKTFYLPGEAEAFLEANPEGFYKIAFEGKR